MLWALAVNASVRHMMPKTTRTFISDQSEIVITFVISLKCWPTSNALFYLRNNEQCKLNTYIKTVQSEQESSYWIIYECFRPLSSSFLNLKRSIFRYNNIWINNIFNTPQPMSFVAEHVLILSLLARMLYKIQKYLNIYVPKWRIRA
jgi:hypothetical protein